MGRSRRGSAAAIAGRPGSGNGALLFIRVDDFEETLARARTLVSRFETDPEVFLSGPDTPTFTVRDLDGYYVMVNSL